MPETNTGYKPFFDRNFTDTKAYNASKKRQPSEETLTDVEDALGGFYSKDKANMSMSSGRSPAMAEKKSSKFDNLGNYVGVNSSQELDPSQMMSTENTIDGENTDMLDQLISGIDKKGVTKTKVKAPAGDGEVEEKSFFDKLGDGAKEVMSDDKAMYEILSGIEDFATSGARSDVKRADLIAKNFGLAGQVGDKRDVRALDRLARYRLNQDLMEKEKEKTAREQQVADSFSKMAERAGKA